MLDRAFDSFYFLIFTWALIGLLIFFVVNKEVEAETDLDRAFDKCKHICNLASKDLSCIDEEADCIILNIEAHIHNVPTREERGALDTKR